MNGLSVCVLGSVRAEHSGRVLAIGSRRQRALLAALAVDFPRAVSVEELIDAIWEEEPPPKARATLQSYVSRLRSKIGDETIEHSSAGYRLSGRCRVDAVDAREALAEARAWLEQDPAAAAHRAWETLAAWDGEGLAEFAGQMWFRPHAAALAELRLNLLDAAAEGMLRSGRPAEAVDLMEPVVESVPFREPSQLLLVESLATAGRTTDALRAADRYRSALRDETGLDPGSALGLLEFAILAGDVGGESSGPADRGEARPADLPRTSRRELPRAGRLVGRAWELSEVERLVRSSRLITVVGAGGVGKTRLVAELVARRSGDEPPAVVVEFASIGPDEVVETMAAALGYGAGRADHDTIVDVLATEEVLLVLDNCEHVLHALPGLLRRIVDACPRTTVVATSRVRLALPDEEVFELGPLDSAGMSSPAAELFIECVGRTHPRRVELPQSGAEIPQLCRLLDGIPLALELAASRAATLGTAPLLARLGSSTELVTSSGVSRDRRHASLHAVVSWSYDLLDDVARRLLAIVTVFEGAFTLEDIEAVAGDLLGDDVDAAFARLVDASMVAPLGIPGRFRLLEMIRRFGADRLKESDDSSAVAIAHLAWTAARSSALASGGVREEHISDAVGGLRDDIRRALEFAVADRRVDQLGEIAHAMGGLLLYRPDPELAALVLDSAVALEERAATEIASIAASGSRMGWLLGELDVAARLAGLALGEAAADRAGPEVRSRARHSLGVLALYEGRFVEARSAFDQVVDDDDAAAMDRVDALGGAALAACYLGEADLAGAYATRHRAMAEALESETACAFSDFVEAERALAIDDFERASGLLEVAADRAWRVGATFVWGLASTVLVATLVRTGAHRDAVRVLPVLLRRWRRTSTWPQLWTSLRLVAEVLAAHGLGTESATLLAAADADVSAPELADSDRERLEVLEEELGESELAVARARVEVIDRRHVLDRAIAAVEGLAAT